MNTSLISNLALIPFVVVSILHLWACIAGEKKERVADWTKLFLMPLLLLFYIISCIMAAEPFFWTIIFALLFSTLGDYYLLNEKNDNWIRWGMLSFFAAQVCYVIFALPNIQWAKINIWVLIGISAAYVIGCSYAIISTLPKSRKGEKKSILIIPTILYGVALCAMSYTFVLLSTQYTSMATTLLAAGGLLFVGSDVLLSRKLFAPSESKTSLSRFLVMLTYIVGQAAIIIGVVMFTQIL